jgi:hypothetical protein
MGQNIVDLADNLFIAKFIIANMADSYGLAAQFKAPDNMENISLLLKTKDNDYINILFNKLQKPTHDGNAINKVRSYENHSAEKVLNIGIIESNPAALYLDLVKLINRS